MLAQLVEQATHVQRPFTRCSGPGFESDLLRVTPPLAHPVSSELSCQ